MSIFNALFQPPWADAVRRYFAIKSGPGVNVVSPEVQISVEPLEIHELLVHLNIQLWGSTRTTAALAANNSAVGIRNPAGSGAIVVVTGIASNQANNNLTVRSGTGTGVGINSSGNVFAREGRLMTALGGSNVALPIVSSYQSPALGGSNTWDQFPVATMMPLVHVLSPGTEVLVAGNALNVAASASFIGYTRKATLEELTTG